jgi:membrane-bound lytic murein transglycosylase D
MPATARDYDLRVGGGVDERKDPLLSTRAAATYLQHLVFEFGSDSLVLALAGYNYGQNRVRWALKQLEDPFSDRSYWRLVERGLLPAETAAYVARFTAAAVAGEAGLPAADALRAAGY